MEWRICIVLSLHSLNSPLKTVLIYEQHNGLFQLFNPFYRAKTLGDHLNGDELYYVDEYEREIVYVCEILIYLRAFLML